MGAVAGAERNRNRTTETEIPTMAAKIVTKDVKVKGVVVGTISLPRPSNAEEWTEIKGKVTLNGKTAKGAPVSTAVDTWDAWYYGAVLKGMAAVRNAATEGVIDNHKISVGGKSTDLDTLPDIKGMAVVNAFRAASAAGMSPGDKNMGKLEHYAAALVAKGFATDVQGTLTTKKNGELKK